MTTEGKGIADVETLRRGGGEKWRKSKMKRRKRRY